MGYDIVEEGTANQLFSKGSGHVRPIPGPATSAKNRELLDVAAPASPTVEANVTTAMESATWDASENVTEITINPQGLTGTSSPGGDGVFVVFNPTNATIAAQWLVEAEHTATNSNRYFVHTGKPRTFRFLTPVTSSYVMTAFDSGFATHHVQLEAN